MRVSLGCANGCTLIDVTEPLWNWRDQPDRHGAEFGEPTSAALPTYSLCQRPACAPVRDWPASHKERTTILGRFGTRANGQSERPVERGIGCNSTHSHRRVGETIGIDAARDIEVHREEIYERIPQERSHDMIDHQK